MGKLLSFEKRPDRRPPARAGGAQGQIVLFTGVRYERAPGEPDKPPATTGKKRKRV